MSETPISPESNASASISSDVNQSPERRLPSSSRRPYQKPGFLVSQAFERQALSCAGCLNQSASFPTLCAMRS